MVKKKNNSDKGTITKEELRYQGARDLPDKWPILRPEQCKTYLIRGLSQAKISFKEAAFLVLGLDPNDPENALSSEKTDEPSRHYYWLKTRYEEDWSGKPLPSGYERLYTKDKNEAGDPIFTPGQIFRFLYSQHKEVSFVAWEIYHQIDNGTFRGFLPDLVFRRNCLEAAKIIWKHIPTANKDFVIAILRTLSKQQINDRDGIPCFGHLKLKGLEKALSNLRGEIKGGRPTEEEKLYLIKNGDRLSKEAIDLIRKYFSTISVQ